MARILVLGAYGFIGSHMARALTAAGHEVVAFGRDRDTARRVLPGYSWIFRDMRDLTTAQAWLDVLGDIDIIVNCAGALQANMRDDLEAVHLHAIGALVLACEKSGAKLVHLSAAGADPSAALRFYRTKAEGEALIRESSADWWIFRPALVLAQTAFGLSENYRMQASIPYVMIYARGVHGTQVIGMDDVIEAVLRAVSGQVPAGTAADLVSEQTYPTLEVTKAMRTWLGFEQPRLHLKVPMWASLGFARLADLASLFGWRAPYRTTAVEILYAGAHGNAAQTTKVLGRKPRGLYGIFLTLRAGTEERLRTRMLLLGPFVFLTLALHWIAGGVVALQNVDMGIDYLLAAGHNPVVAKALVYIAALVTLVLGVSLLVRRMAHRSLVMMALFSIVYLIGATIAIPALWLDPLGPLVKVFPIIVLTLVARVMIDSR